MKPSCKTCTHSAPVRTHWGTRKLFCYSKARYCHQNDPPCLSYHPKEKK